MKWWYGECIIACLLLELVNYHKSRGPKRGPEALSVLEWHRLRKCSCLNFETFYLTLLYYHYSMLKHPFYERQSTFSPGSLVPVVAQWNDLRIWHITCFYYT